MKSSPRPAAAEKAGRWTSLWVVALLSLVAQLGLCQFFAQEPATHAFGEMIPFSEDFNPSKLWTLAYTFPPTGTFQVLNWLGLPYLPQPLNPLSLAGALMSPWFFFTTYVPLLSTLALLAMAAFLRELEVSRPAALFGAVTYAWQGDVLSFIYPGHYGYLTSWPFFALGAWSALRAERTGRWPYAVIGGVCCGTMVGLITNADRGGIASALIGALFLAPLLRDRTSLRPARHFLLCVGVALVVALAPLLALFKSNINPVTLGGQSGRDEIYKMVVQYSLGPSETLSYLVPGFFGWSSNTPDGRYWGWIGEWPDWEAHHTGPANLNLAISTCGTLAALLAVMGALRLLPGPGNLGDRPRFYARVLLVLGLVSLVLSWGIHLGTFYRFIYDHVPLMDKWRNPLKWLEWFNFALMPLGALGLEQVLATLDSGDETTRARRRRFLLFVGVALGVLLAGIVATYALGEVARRHFLAQDLDPLTVAGIVDTMHAALFRALVLTTALGVVPYSLWHADTLRRATLVNPWLQSLWQKILRAENLPLTLALTLAALGTAQLGWVAQHFIQPTPIGVMTASDALLDVLRHEGNRVRCSVAVDDPTLNFLLQNQFAGMGISCVDISAASRYPVDLNAFFQAYNGDRAPLWFLAGVRNLVVPEQGLNDLRQEPDVATNMDHVDGYTLAPTPSPDLPSHAFIALKDTMAKATLVPGCEVLTRDAILKRLIDPKWNPRASVLLTLAREDDPAANGDLAENEAITFPAGPRTPSEVDRVHLNQYTPTYIEVAVESTRNAFLLINDYYDHDWQVQVNGENAPLLRADYVMRAIAVPAGSSTVTLNYVPHYGPLPTLAVSLFSDGAMLAAWIVAGLALRRR